MIDFKCPECGELLSVPSSLAGKSETCPTCKHDVPVPPGNGGEQDRLRRVFLCDTPAEVEVAIAKIDDNALAAAFMSLDMERIPLNTFCRKHFSHPRGTDSRIITLAIALASLAKAGRMTPAAALAEKLAAKFAAKIERGPSPDTAVMPSDEWRIHAAVNKFLVDWAKELMKDGVDRHESALAMLDAIATDWPEDDIVLFWRAAAAYNIWCGEKTNAGKKAAAHGRMTAFLGNTSHRTMDARSVNMIREFRDAMH